MIKTWKNTKAPNERRGLQLRQGVARKDLKNMLDKLNEIESLQNKHDDKRSEISTFVSTFATTSNVIAKDVPPNNYSAYLEYMKDNYDRMDIDELRASLNQFRKKNLG